VTLENRISELPDLPKAKLLAIWSENFNQAPPQTLRKELMVPILAYRMQEREFGGLSHRARRRLQEITSSQKKGKQPPKALESGPELGTRIVRSWRGELHEVLVSGEAYEYRGRQYSSLSKIANEITGAHWSGPAFFGTKGKGRK
jgi:Protein of unknown function (DUF2924)